MKRISSRLIQTFSDGNIFSNMPSVGLHDANELCAFVQMHATNHTAFSSIPKRLQMPIPLKLKQKIQILYSIHLKHIQ